MKIFKFFSPTCGPCKVLDRNLKEAGIQYESIDVTDDANEELITKYGITSVPILLYVGDNGETILKYRGIMTVDDLNKYFK